MAQSFKDTVDVTDGNGPTTVTINGNRGAVYAGGGGKSGSVRMKDGAGTERVSIGAWMLWMAVLVVVVRQRSYADMRAQDLRPGIPRVRAGVGEPSGGRPR